MTKIVIFSLHCFFSFSMEKNIMKAIREGNEEDITYLARCGKARKFYLLKDTDISLSEVEGIRRLESSGWDYSKDFQLNSQITLSPLIQISPLGYALMRRNLTAFALITRADENSLTVSGLRETEAYKYRPEEQGWSLQDMAVYQKLYNLFSCKIIYGNRGKIFLERLSRNEDKEQIKDILSHSRIDTNWIKRDWKLLSSLNFSLENIQFLLENCHFRDDTYKESVKQTILNSLLIGASRESDTEKVTFLLGKGANPWWKKQKAMMVASKRDIQRMFLNWHPPKSRCNIM